MRYASPMTETKAEAPTKPRRRRRLWIAVGVVLLLLTVDALRPPSRQWGATALLAGIDLYQATLSPLIPKAGVKCRFSPTCSHYGEGVIRKHGAYKGSILTAWRILRCGPWTPAGTHDPP